MALNLRHQFFKNISQKMFNEEQRKKGQSFILVNFIFFYFLDHVWGYSCNLLLMTAIEKVDQSLSQIQISGNCL